VNAQRFVNIRMMPQPTLIDNEHGDKTLCQSCLEYVTDDYWHDSAKERGI
jgi:hypothetical protein